MDSSSWAAGVRGTSTSVLSIISVRSRTLLEARA
jgi:hypothetical protein